MVDGVKKVKLKRDGKDTLVAMDVSILTVLEKVDDTHTKLIFRLRTRVSLAYYIPARGLGGLFDYTVPLRVMASGLNERVKQRQGNKKRSRRHRYPPGSINLSCNFLLFKSSNTAI